MNTFLRKYIPFFLVGIFFGITMSKSEAISWYRIQEMFRFESFHMYGIIGVAVVASALIIFVMKRFKIKTLRNTYVSYTPLPLNVTRHLLSGTIFGLGWALVGACPGPMYVLLGQGYAILIVVILGGLLGTFTYGVVREYLPH